MTLLPSYQAEPKKRKPNKRSARKRGSSFVVLAILFVGYQFWRRASGAAADQPHSPDSVSGRRDLKERGFALAGVRAGLHGGTAPRPPAVTETFPTLANSTRVLLLTHSRVMWYNYATDDLQVVHEGQGIYYGGFPGATRTAEGAPATLWVVSRPHNWRPTSAKEWLVELDAESGAEVQRVQLPSRFTHDTVRQGDRVFAANTGEGKVVELSFPDMNVLREMELFTEKEHVNTLSPVGDGTMWAMLHNLGPSVLAQVDLASGSVVRRLEPIGLKSHGAVQWRGAIVGLDSDHAALMRVDPLTGAVTRLWAAPEAQRYLKGLCVVDDVAFFGIAQAQERKSRDSTELNCELAAYDLAEDVLLWRRQLPTRGLLNVVAAPHLQVESTAQAVALPDPAAGYRGTPQYVAALAAVRAPAKAGAGRRPVTSGDNAALRVTGAGRRGAGGDALGTAKQVRSSGKGSGKGSREAGEDLVRGHGSAVPGAPKPSLLEVEPLDPSDPLSQYPPKLGARWASGYPRLDLARKSHGEGLASGAQLPLFRADVSRLRDFILGMPLEDWGEEVQRRSNAWLTGRSVNLNQFKPGTTAIHLIFSDHDGGEVFEFPWYKARFARLMEPILVRMLGVDVSNIIRLQLARMPPDSHIRKHVDKGGYSADGHRLHIVVASSPDVTFQVCEGARCVALHVEEGLVFELNNRLEHFVDNAGSSPRVHLVVDVVESPRQRRLLSPGQVCRYHGTIDCDEKEEEEEEEQ